YLSLDNQLGQDDVLIDEIPNQVALDPGEAYQSTAKSFVVPKRFRGQVFVIVAADAKNQMDEWPNETNNVVATPLYVEPLPLADLVVSDVQFPEQVVEGSTVNLRFTVTNKGTGPTDADAWTDTVWLTRDKNRPHPEDGDILLARLPNVRGLPVQAGYDQSISITIPSVPPGQWYITPWADPYGNVTEDPLAANDNPDDDE